MQQDGLPELTLLLMEVIRQNKTNTYERILRQSPVDNRRHGQFRERRAEEVPGLGHPGDPHLLARREEAGRHAPPPPGAVPGAGREGEVLHRQREGQKFC